jgi:hypothetical protein
MPAGIESVGTNPLPRNGRSIKGIGRLLAVSTLLDTMAERDRKPGKSERDHRENADRRDPLDRTGGGPESDEQCDTNDQCQAEHRLCHAANDVSGQDR